MKLKGKKKYGIIGLPRSGTTVTTKIFHNIDNCLAFSEPIRGVHYDKCKIIETWRLENLPHDPQRIGSNEIGSNDLDKNSLNPIVGACDSVNSFRKHIELLYRENNQNIFVKETFSNVQKNVNKDILKFIANTDHVIFVVREPKALYSAWRELKEKDGELRERYKFNVGQFINMYNDFIKFYMTISKVKPCTVISYEELCDAANMPFSSDDMDRDLSTYLNTLLETDEFSGNLGRLQHEPIISMGDHKSFQSTSVKSARLTHSNIESFERDLINNLLLDKYKKLIPEKFEFTLKVNDSGPEKLKLIKVIKLNSGYGLKECKDCLDGYKDLKINMSIAYAKQFEGELKRLPTSPDVDLDCKQLYRKEYLEKLLDE